MRSLPGFKVKQQNENNPTPLSLVIVYRQKITWTRRWETGCISQLIKVKEATCTLKIIRQRDKEQNRLGGVLSYIGTVEKAGGALTMPSVARDIKIQKRRTICTSIIYEDHREHELDVYPYINDGEGWATTNNLRIPIKIWQTIWFKLAFAVIPQSLLLSVAQCGRVEALRRWWEEYPVYGKLNWEINLHHYPDVLYQHPGASKKYIIKILFTGG